MAEDLGIRFPFFAMGHKVIKKIGFTLDPFFGVKLIMEANGLGSPFFPFVGLYLGYSW